MQRNIDLQKLEFSTVKSLKELHSRWSEFDSGNWSESEWTKRVIVAIDDACKNTATKLSGYRHWFGFKGAERSNSSAGEWLFDYSWRAFRLTEDPWRWELLSVPVIAECEWQLGQEHISDDLTKVLIGSAELGIFIHQACEGTQSYILDQVLALRNKGPERMLIACWSTEGFQFTSFDRSANVRRFK
ncbi:MAG: hypothetical protein GC188_06950 [Alphaproteobacteria bacterium]|nr:hypothetical protein [Alphaproteobacteria bacterium]